MGEGGFKRFEVFVCTGGECDYGLEMWRLLDPGFNLITSNELLDRVACIPTTGEYFSAVYCLMPFLCDLNFST